jgi:hypothetical protein
LRTPWITLGIGAFLVIAAILRMCGYTVPSLVVASFSVVAVLTSLSDLLEILKTRKKHQHILLFFALVFFIISLIIWVFFPNINEEIATTIGDGFTILGLALVIGLFGFKELKASSTKDDYKKAEFIITKHEYDEMLKLNDVIENLKKVTNDTFSLNRVHNGWALFYDSLAEHWYNGRSPFYDGLNRALYWQFLKKLDEATEMIGDIADTNYRTFRTQIVKMWGEDIEVIIQPRINNPYVPTINDVNNKLKDALDEWEKLKKQITKRYEQERAQQGNIREQAT